MDVITCTGFTDAVNKSVEEFCQVSVAPVKPWIDADCLELIEQRRLAKRDGVQSAKYKRLNKKVHKACRKAKKNYMNNIASEAEAAFKLGASRKVFDAVKRLVGKKGSTSGIGVKDENGNLILDRSAIKKRWETYCRNLFSKDVQDKDDDDDATDDVPENELEPEVLLDEIRKAIHKLKNDKAVGLDGIPAEALKAGGETVVSLLKSIIDHVWKTGEWPDEWTVSELVVMPKVAGTQECTKHRTLSLISHASKVLLEILRERLNHFLGPEIADEQFGFVSGKGTTDAMLVLRNVIEKVKDKQDQELWLMFIDYAKAFDSVNHAALWRSLTQLGTPKHLVKLIRGLYNKARGVVRVGNDHTDEFPFEKGVRQGCLISPLLFNISGESIMREVKAQVPEAGFKINQEIISNIRYADDTTLLESNKDGLEHLANVVKDESLKFGLKINETKTNVMTLNGTGKVNLGNAELDPVQNFKYLGSVINMDEPTAKEVQVRLAIARGVTSDLTKIWKDRNLSLAVKKRIACALVLSVASYGCESWTLRKSEENAIRIFELWLWRRVLM